MVLQVLVGRDIRRVLRNQQRVGACTHAAGNQLIQLPAGVPAGLLALGYRPRDSMCGLGSAADLPSIHSMLSGLAIESSEQPLP